MMMFYLVFSGRWEDSIVFLQICRNMMQSSQQTRGIHPILFQTTATALLKMKTRIYSAPAVKALYSRNMFGFNITPEAEVSYYVGG